jgi:hypothetical protein
MKMMKLTIQRGHDTMSKECRICFVEKEDDEQCLKKIRKCEYRKDCCFSRLMENICSFAKWYTREEGQHEQTNS